MRPDFMKFGHEGASQIVFCESIRVIRRLSWLFIPQSQRKTGTSSGGKGSTTSTVRDRLSRNRTPVPATRDRMCRPTTNPAAAARCHRSSSTGEGRRAAPAIKFQSRNPKRNLLPFPEAHEVDLPSAEIDALEINLRLPNCLLSRPFKIPFVRRRIPGAPAVPSAHPPPAPVLFRTATADRFRPCSPTSPPGSSYPYGKSGCYGQLRHARNLRPDGLMNAQEVLGNDIGKHIFRVSLEIVRIKQRRRV